MGDRRVTVELGIDADQFIAGLNRFVEALRDFGIAVGRAGRRAKWPRPTPHCHQHESHAMSCHDCVNALAGLYRAGDQRG